MKLLLLLSLVLVGCGAEQEFTAQPLTAPAYESDAGREGCHRGEVDEYSTAAEAALQCQDLNFPNR